MTTVVLDNKQKASVLKDFNDFLHPRTARWYSNRGIPYRRGYMFHGYVQGNLRLRHYANDTSPPGTGKTSLSFSLAGVFGLDVYCLALSEATLTEEDLILLFNSLPKRCILLLEDVDTAGLRRPHGAKNTSKQEYGNRSSSIGGTHGKKKNTAAALAGEEGPSVTIKDHIPDGPSTSGRDSTFKNTLTLSGLLNAIDGVASQEGRVLIMTTVSAIQMFASSC